MRTVADVGKALAAGERVRFLFFWGHQGAATGKGCLSQWFPSPFTENEHTFATAEHYMMWRKATLFDDRRTAAAILAAGHPKQAKDLGRQVRDFDQVTWEAQRSRIVVDGNTRKFAQHDDMRAFLLGTGGHVLVEASPLDRVWGIGLREDDPRAGDPATWRGQNLLGFALGAVRDVLAGDDE
ncbi:NADAR family protein [Actinophytocola glycyrrhizae]|uniref:NADAR family protein n=1 Tax=Actinophytocola glycyrrhizae TaxID=2044873 RepID=A0ABV9S0K3_9PSEU